MGLLKKIFLTITTVLGLYFVLMYLSGKPVNLSKSNKPLIALPGTNLNKATTPTLTLQENSTKVVFDGEKFSPEKITIKAGDKVTFVNSSKINLWPAADPHPLHTSYPELDSKKLVLPGEEVSFILSKVGMWTYHDHLMPSSKGTIVIEP